MYLPINGASDLIAFINLSRKRVSELGLWSPKSPHGQYRNGCGVRVRNQEVFSDLSLSDSNTRAAVAFVLCCSSHLFVQKKIHIVCAKHYTTPRGYGIEGNSSALMEIIFEGGEEFRESKETE